ncbi:MAG: hypothetical protein R2748_25735 [Bryobacterales bacterium]
MLLLGAGFVLGGSTLTAAGAFGLAAAGVPYLAASFVASLAAAREFGWRLLPVLPLVFLTYHASYGLGFLLGLIRHGRQQPGGLDEALFSGVTR